jgi:hypothetical protein
LAGDDAFGLQKVVGGGDSGAVQSKRTSQFAGGWEAFASGELSGLDETAKMGEELLIDREGG